jgi:Flp pilus assembly protein TadG
LPERRELSKGRHRSRLVGLGRRARGESGQALVEFTLVAMVFFLIVFGIIDFARFFQSWVTVQHAAREGARYAITGRVDCDTYSDNRQGCIQYVAKQATTGLSGAPGNVTVSFKSWDYPGYTQEHDGSAGDQCDAMEVKVDYDFTFAAPIIGDVLGAVHIPIAGRERMVNEPFGPCR